MMILLFRRTLLVCLVGLCPWVHAQKIPRDSIKTAPLTQPAQATPSADLIPQITPKSPTAAALGRYGEYPVSMYTGLPTIEIPIHEFKVGSLTVPIKLTYHASGNKVNDLASWVGLGWSLQTGGMVTRTVQGTADEQSVGALGQTLKDPYEYYQASCLTADVENRFGRLADGLLDGQRDLFSYQLPTASNTFILSPTGVVPLMTNNVKVDAPTNLSQFNITDESGTSYHFGAGETTTGVNYGYISSWYLSQIVSAINNDKAIYTYTTNTTSQFAPNWTDTQVVNSLLDDPDNISGVQIGLGVASSYNQGAAVTQQLLSEINFPGGRLRFVLDTQDRLDGGKSLDRIEVLGYNVLTGQFDLTRTYDFQYSYKYRTDNGGPVLFLESVRLLQVDGSSIGQYTLGYNETPLPPPTAATRIFGATQMDTIIAR